MKKRFFYGFLVFSLLLTFLSTPAMAKQLNILVYPFENNGDKQYSWISAGMTDTVINDLTGIREVSVISNADRKKIMEETKFILSGLVEEETMVKVGKLMGANIIFSGSYMVSGNNIRVIARLINVETGKTKSSAKLDGTLDKIFALQDKVVLTLLSETGKASIAGVNKVNIAEAEKKKIKEKPRSTTAAYELYAKGLELQETNPKEALAYFKKALEIDGNYVSALIEVGFTAGGTLNLFDEALGYLNRADSILKARKTTNTADYATLMKNIGAVFGSKGDMDRAMQYFTDSQQIWANLGLQNTADYAKITVNIGKVYLSKGDLNRSLKYFTDSQVMWDRLGLQNTADYARLLMYIGVVYRDKGVLDSSLQYFTDSQQIQDKLGLQNTLGYAALMESIGTVYGSKGDLNRSLKYFTDSQQTREKLGLQNTAKYAALMGNIGIVYKGKGDLNRSLKYFTDSRVIWDSLGLQNTADYATLMKNIGDIYGSKGDLDNALKHFINSQEIKNRLGLQNTLGYAALLSNMGILYEKQGYKAMAGRYYRNAYDTYIRAGYVGPNKDKALSNARRLGY